jgi:hypothetical protein
MVASRGAESTVSEPTVYTGICGASAAAAIGQEGFVVADDESNRLRVYARNKGGPALQSIDLTPQLELDWRAPEIDLEGAARLGDYVYWITSHSRNKKGKEHPNRYRFFATAVRSTNAGARIEFVGRPYKTLLRDLAAAPALQRYSLAAASRLAPKARGGLNIEGLCSTADQRLLIAFRNPIPNGHALLVPLENPEQMIEGSPAKIGPAIELDLDGLGIRDMAFWQGEYLIIAGSFDGKGKSKLYRWAGGKAKPRHLKEVNLKGLNPEAIVVYPKLGLEEVQLLSDDSSRSSVDCNNLPISARQFRGVWVSP